MKFLNARARPLRLSPKPRGDHYIDGNNRVLGVVRSILGMTAPEWAELARSELDSDMTQGSARTLDRQCREDPEYIRKAVSRYQNRVENVRKPGRAQPIRPKTLERLDHLISILSIPRKACLEFIALAKNRESVKSEKLLRIR